MWCHFLGGPRLDSAWSIQFGATDLGSHGVCERTHVGSWRHCGILQRDINKKGIAAIVVVVIVAVVVVVNVNVNVVPTQ